MYALLFTLPAKGHFQHLEILNHQPHTWLQPRCVGSEQPKQIKLWFRVHFSSKQTQPVIQSFLGLFNLRAAWTRSGNNKRGLQGWALLAITHSDHDRISTSARRKPAGNSLLIRNHRWFYFGLNALEVEQNRQCSGEFGWWYCREISRAKRHWLIIVAPYRHASRIALDKPLPSYCLFADNHHNAHGILLIRLCLWAQRPLLKEWDSYLFVVCKWDLRCRFVGWRNCMSFVSSEI